VDWTERLNRGPGRITLGQGTVELLQWAYQEHLPDNKPHRHTFFEVCQMGRYGAGHFSAEGRDHVLMPGTVFVARPGVVHQIVNTADVLMELFWVCFQWTPDSSKPPGEVDRLIQDFAQAAVIVSPDTDGRLAAQWQALRVLAAGNLLPGSEALMTAQITALLLTIAQVGAGVEAVPVTENSDIANAPARLAVRFIHDNLSRPLSVDEIAAQVFTSPRHLSRLFQRFTGVSPAVYVVHARIDRARGLLAHTRTPIKDVAEAVGYPDVHHFSRVFTQQVGCPPGEYRRDPSRRPVRNIQTPGELV
jgi:AraC-like DNA-binding protein